MTVRTKDSFFGNLYTLFMLLVFPIFMWPLDEDGKLRSAYLQLTRSKLTFHMVALAGVIGLLLLAYAFSPMSKKKTQSADGEREEFPKPTLFTNPKGWFAQNEWLVAVYVPDLFLLLFFVGGLITWKVAPLGGDLNPAGRLSMFFGDVRYDGLFYYFTYAMVYFVTAHFGSFKTSYAKAFSVVLLAMSLITVVQLSGVNFLDFYPVRSHNGFYNYFVSTIGNVDIAGGFFCTAIPLVGVGYVVFKLNRFFSALFLLCHTVTVYVMFSIGVDITVVTMAALTVVLTPVLMQNRRYAIKVIEIGFSLVVGIWFSFLVDYRYEKAEELTYTVFKNSPYTPVFFGAVAVLFAVWYGLQQDKFANKINWRKMRYAMVIAILSVAVGGFCYFRFVSPQPTVPGLASDLYNLVRLNLPDSAGTHRAGIWRHALMMAQDNLWFGTGCGTFGQTFREFSYKTNYTRYATPRINLDFAHNEYVHYLCTQGLFGLLTYLGFIGSSLVLAYRYFKKNPRILVLAAAVLGYSMQVFFCFSIVISAPFFWLLLGLMMREIRVTAKACHQPDPVPVIEEEIGEETANQSAERQDEQE